MTEIVYQDLARHLDSVPGGFAPSKSGAEIRILQRLFTPEEAQLALQLDVTAETAEAVAHRAGLPAAEVEERLQEMAQKGLLFCYYKEDAPPEYLTMPWVLGIYEFQVSRLDLPLLRDIGAYSRETVNPEGWKAAPQMRTVPVGESIPVHNDVLIHEQAQELAKGQERYAVAPCICRQKQELVGSSCGKPLETCLMFNEFAEYYVRTGLGRAIDEAEALAIIEAADRDGLVLQPGNARMATSICCCCGDCCGILGTAKLHPQPATVLSSPYIAQLDLDDCNDCALCTTRCQMEALEMGDDGLIHYEHRCIGCGLCVTTCTTGALSLARKPQAEQPLVPQDFTDMRVTIGQATGRMGSGELVEIVV